MATKRRLFDPNSYRNDFNEQGNNGELIDLNGNLLPQCNGWTPRGPGLNVLAQIFESTSPQQSELALIFENDTEVVSEQTKRVHMCGRPPANPEFDLITSNVIQCLDLTRSLTLSRIMIQCVSLTSLTMENVLFPPEQLTTSFNGLNKLQELRLFNCDVALKINLDSQRANAIKYFMGALEILEVINCAQRLSTFCDILLGCPKLKHYSGETAGDGSVPRIFGMETISLRQAALTMDRIIEIFYSNPTLECIDFDGLELIGYDTTAEELGRSWFYAWQNLACSIRRVKLCDMKVRLVYRKWHKMEPIKTSDRFQPFIPSHFLKPGPLHSICLDERDFYDSISEAHPDVVWFYCPNDEKHIERTALEPSVLHWEKTYMY